MEKLPSVMYVVEPAIACVISSWSFASQDVLNPSMLVLVSTDDAVMAN